MKGNSRVGLGLWACFVILQVSVSQRVTGAFFLPKRAYLARNLHIYRVESSTHPQPEEVVMHYVEVFHAPTDYELPVLDHSDEAYEAGWYYWFVQPGCLPDSEPFGPFDTEHQAQADAQAEGV